MNWVQAFAKQACSDFDAREALCETDLPHCHQLHYLQMAMEKASKAHQLAMPSPPEDLLRTHGVITKAIPMIVRHGLSQKSQKPKPWIMSAVQSLARQLNGLHPQIDKEYQPANCEYPWKNPSAEDIIAPVDHNFNIDLNQRVVVTILKEVRARAEELRHWEYE